MAFVGIDLTEGEGMYGVDIYTGVSGWRVIMRD